MTHCRPMGSQKEPWWKQSTPRALQYCIAYEHVLNKRTIFFRKNISLNDAFCPVPCGELLEAIC